MIVTVPTQGEGGGDFQAGYLGPSMIWDILIQLVGRCRESDRVRSCLGNDPVGPVKLERRALIANCGWCRFDNILIRNTSASPSRRKRARVRLSRKSPPRTVCRTSDVIEVSYHQAHLFLRPHVWGVHGVKRVKGLIERVFCGWCSCHVSCPWLAGRTHFSCMMCMVDEHCVSFKIIVCVATCRFMA